MSNPSRITRDLIRIIENRAGEPTAVFEVDGLIQADADITAPVNNRYMIHCVVEQYERYRQTIPWKANHCYQIYLLLKNRASQLLVDTLQSQGDIDIDKMSLMISLHADTYQGERFGPFGLLGTLLLQNQRSIPLAVVQKLVEGYSTKAESLMAGDEQDRSCLSVAKANATCPSEIVDYLQHQFDQCLNTRPFLQPKIDADVIALWIRRGANTEYVDEQGNTVLTKAVLANELELVRSLVSYGADPHHRNADQRTPLDIARSATPRNPELIACLELQARNLQLRQLIENKKAHLTIDEVKDLCQKGANVNALHANCNSFLHLLIVNQAPSELVAAFLSDFSVDVTLTNNRYHRALETAVLCDKEPYHLLKALVSHPKVVTSMFFNSKLNQSLLTFANEQKRSGVGKVIEHELHQRLWNCVTKAKCTTEQHQKIIDDFQQLIEYGARINHRYDDKDYEQWTILHAACRSTTKEFVQFLVEQLKADHLAVNARGDRPLAIAAEHGQLSIVEYLTKLPDANLNHANQDRQTSLHRATRNHHILIVRFLVLWGADHQAKNAAQQTALDIAKTNTSKNKDDESNDKQLIVFLEQLICPPVAPSTATDCSPTVKPRRDFDACIVVDPVTVQQIANVNTDPNRLGDVSKGFLAGTPNSNLHDGAEKGDVHAVNQALADGADICNQKRNSLAYHTAYRQLQRSQAESHGYSSNLGQRAVQQTYNYSMIMSTIQRIADEKMTQAIDQSNAGLVRAYHQAGAQLTPELLNRTCSTSDNVEIIDYFIQQSPEVWNATIYSTATDTLYRLARKKKFDRVAAYLKYQLSVECTKAVKDNNLSHVTALLAAGANPDMRGTTNLLVALTHRNIDMIRVLCDHGAKIPDEWMLDNTNYSLPASVIETIPADIAHCINRYLLNRQLRYFAANGNLVGVIECQRRGADINGRNCHGSTALLCAIQHDNYFPIVHALVSSGASLLHTNDDEPMSLVDLARSRRYESIANYLMAKLNHQFILAIINNDLSSAKQYTELGADINYQDEQQRIALHYAAQYHTVDVVRWLCSCGSHWDQADRHGDYPILLATEKGDYLMVEYFITEYPMSKNLKNRAGQTAQQLAAKLKYTRIEELIRNGATSQDVPDQKNSERTREELIDAAERGYRAPLEKFCREPYKSSAEKRALCFELIGIAQRVRQEEIVALLKSWYEVELSSAMDRAGEKGPVVRLKEQYRQMLLGFLNGLSEVIAGCEVILDPADPNTHKQLFSGLADRVAQDAKELFQNQSEVDAKKWSEHDLAHSTDKLRDITHKLDELRNGRGAAINGLQMVMSQLGGSKVLPAAERMALLEQEELYQQQLNVHECSIALYERQDEAIKKRQTTVQFIKDSVNLIMFFRVVENRLQSLFHRTLSVQIGSGQIDGMTTSNEVSNAPSRSQALLFPLAELMIESVEYVLYDVSSKLDKKNQKKEWLNIRALCYISEMERIAADTASMVTIYYKEQIEAIDSCTRMRRDNILNDQVLWIKDLLDQTGPHTAEEMAATVFAEYITGWIFDGLTIGRKEIASNQSLSQQLWLYVAKKDPIRQTTAGSISTSIKPEAGQQKIPLKKKIPCDGRLTPMRVQLRYLMGCVSVVSQDGKVYQYDVRNEKAVEELQDLAVFGYVYLSSFSSDVRELDFIIKGRKLDRAKLDAHNNIFTKVDVIQSPISAPATSNGDIERRMPVTKDIAERVAQVLRDQKIFLDSEDVKAALNGAVKKNTLSVAALEERVHKMEDYFREKLQATQQKLNDNFKKNVEGIRKENQEKYDQWCEKLLGKLDEFSHQLKRISDQRLIELEKQYCHDRDQMQKKVDAVNAASQKALEHAQQGEQTCKGAFENVKHATDHVKELCEVADEKQKEVHLAVLKNEEMVKETAREQNAYLERAISEFRQQLAQELEGTRKAATSSAINAEESSKNSKSAASSAKEAVKSMEEQLKMRKKEVDETRSFIGDIKHEVRRSSDQVQHATTQTQKAERNTERVLEKVEAACQKMHQTLQNLELKRSAASK